MDYDIDCMQVKSTSLIEIEKNSLVMNWKSFCETIRIYFEDLKFQHLKFCLITIDRSNSYIYMFLMCDIGVLDLFLM